MKIKIKLLDLACTIEPNKKGEWIDLRARYNSWLAGPQVEILSKPKGQNNPIAPVITTSTLLSLGVSMKLPKYFEANILPRSSTFSSFGIIMANGMGIVDSTYCGNLDEWKFNALVIKDSHIEAGDRIAQFRIRPSQFAPWWVKLKWLFVNKIEFDYVEDLKNPTRGGFGSTGLK